MKLSPEAVGFTNARRRRTPGLRREEVAELAGIGIDWYVRLEQGRTVSPSAATIDALARALRLSAVERAHLEALATADERRGFVRETVPDALRRMIDTLAHPAYITGRRFDVLAWNAAAADIVVDFGELPEADRNIIVYMVTNPDARRLFGDAWESEAKRSVALFHAAHDMWGGDPAFLELLARLRSGSGSFAAWWDAHDIRDNSSGVKLLHHPTRGPLRFEYATFSCNDDPALKLAIYTPASTERS